MINKKFKTLYILLAFLLMGMLCLMTGLADQEEGETGPADPPKIAFFGDSITKGNNGAKESDGINPVKYPYPSLVGKLLNVETVNYGIGNTGWIGLNGKTEQSAYYKISRTDLTSYDHIVLCYGVNDSNWELGTWDSADESTVMGQFNKTVQYLLGLDLKAQIIIVAPWNTVFLDRGYMAECMKQAADFYGISFIEMTGFPFEPTTEALPDNVHPDQEHYKMIAVWMAQKLKDLTGIGWAREILSVEMEGTKCTYTGKAQTRKLSVYGSKDGSFSKLDKDDYTVVYKNNIDVGTAKITVNGANGYSGQATGSFTIEPAKLSSVVLKYSSLRFTGKPVTQSQLTVVKFGETVLKYGRDYSISYQNNVDVGKATMTVKGKGNYTGTIKKTFKIVPAPTSITEVTSSAAGKMVVRWNKQSVQTTGYQIEYSRKRDFSAESRKIKVTKNTSTVRKITELESGVTYFVRIRTYKTVGGTTYYSAWSTKKYVRIPKK